MMAQQSPEPASVPNCCPMRASWTPGRNLAHSCLLPRRSLF
jgi:hypothetical protein